jgi:AcrR family transcriptional regulator
MTSLRHKSAGATRSAERSAADLALDAAREAILAVGWSRTTLTDIARRAGVSRMTIYRKWPDMGTLLADLMTREWSGLVHVDGSGSGALDRLVRSGVATVRAIRANPLFARIVELDPELLLPYLLHRRGRSQDMVLDLLEDAIRAGQRTGTVRDGKPAVIARSLVLAAHGFVLSGHTMVDDEVGEEDLYTEARLVIARMLAP